MDVHKKSTTYAVRNQKGNIIQEGETATLYPEVHRELKEYLRFAEFGLEASTSYYKLYQGFLRNNVSVKVANTIQMRQLIAKNDKLDARRLAEMLRLGSFPTSYIPNDEIQHLRSLVNLRHSFMEEKTRCNIRIQAYLDRCDIVMPPQKAFSEGWKRDLMQRMGKGEISAEIRHAYDEYEFLEKKNKQVDQEMIGYTRKYWNTEYTLLQSITGIGPVVGCYVVANVLPISRFASKRKLRRYIGAVPTFLESGGKSSKGRIPKTSSRGVLRWALIQSVNAIAKTHTNLAAYYKKKKKQKKNTGVAKVAVVSSLSDIIYEVLTTKKPYVAG